MEKHKLKVSEEILNLAMMALLVGDYYIFKFGFYLYNAQNVSNTFYFLFVFTISLFLASILTWQMGFQKIKYSQIQSKKIKTIFWMLYIIFSLVVSLALIPIIIIGLLASGYKMINLILHNLKKTNRTKSQISKPHRYQLLRLTEIIFSTKTQKDTFEQIMADWDIEVFESAATDAKQPKLLSIASRNFYAYVKAMWQKSPIGDLVDFIIKVAK